MGSYSKTKLVQRFHQDVGGVSRWCALYLPQKERWGLLSPCFINADHLSGLLEAIPTESSQLTLSTT